MSMSDPISDMLTRIRNALLREHAKVRMPSSNIKENIALVLKKEGYISDYIVESARVGFELTVSLRYDGSGDPIIRTIQRESKPGLRVFKGYKEIKPMLNGQGIYIISTSKGVMSDLQCRKLKIGGEVLCAVS